MDLEKMTKDELELLSNKDITNLILEESNKSINTAELFKRIIKLLELPESEFEKKIADYYTSLATDKRFILLADGTWDLRSRHTSDKVVKVQDEDEEDEEETEGKDEDEENNDDDSLSEDSYDDTDDTDYDDETNEELKDLVIIDEDELELEE